MDDETSERPACDICDDNLEVDDSHGDYIGTKPCVCVQHEPEFNAEDRDE